LLLTCGGLETLHDIFILYLQRLLTPHEIGMDDKHNNAGLYLLGGVAIAVALVWVFSQWWV
jgi:hypothetical protein